MYSADTHSTATLFLKINSESEQQKSQSVASEQKSVRMGTNLVRIPSTHADSQVEGAVTYGNGGNPSLEQNEWSQFYTSMVKTD
jgi:hypothetical protein